MFLMTGNCRPQRYPASTVTMPTPISHSDFRCGSTRGFVSSMPANTPIRQVPIAGKVLSRPSGSQLPSHLRPGR